MIKIKNRVTQTKVVCPHRHNKLKECFINFFQKVTNLLTMLKLVLNMINEMKQVVKLLLNLKLFPIPHFM